jgi:hypothetical protein
MNGVRWNQEAFAEFTRLRDAFRAAKKGKNLQEVLSIGAKIIDLDKAAPTLQIAAGIVLKDMAAAAYRLGDAAAAVTYWTAARAKLIDLKQQPGEWQKDIEAIDKKLEKLKGSQQE